jgi:hypothetical protein
MVLGRLRGSRGGDCSISLVLGKKLVKLLLPVNITTLIFTFRGLRRMMVLGRLRGSRGGDCSISLIISYLTTAIAQQGTWWHHLIPLNGRIENRRCRTNTGISSNLALANH